MIAPDSLAALNAGQRSSATLAEALAVDFALLVRACFPDHPALAAAVDGLGDLGISARMTAMGRLLRADFDADTLAGHPSDTVRGWACFIIGAQDLPLAAQLAAIRPFADDPHFGVREWAWLAVRPAIAANLADAISLLTPWTADASDRIRRFASEATRPRGVWCKHIAALKTDPEPGRPLLEPLRADPSVYVQDSVSNWLNDAAKSRPDWVRSVVADWQAGPANPATDRIARRALRSIEKA